MDNGEAPLLALPPDAAAGDNNPLQPSVCSTPATSWGYPHIRGTSEMVETRGVGCVHLVHCGRVLQSPRAHGRVRGWILKMILLLIGPSRLSVVLFV